MNSLSGTTLAAMPDGTILASGKNPQRETFVIEGETSLNKLTGIRVEALPHEQLPRGGPGRDIYGNAIVSEIKVEVEASGGEWSRDDTRASFRTMAARRTSAPRKLWIIDASREEKRVPPAVVLIPASADQVERTPQTTDFNSSGF